MILHIIQARSTSSRLPNKILKKIGDKTLLEWHISNTVSGGITTALTVPYKDPKLKEITKIADKYKVKVYSNKTEKRDVLGEFVLVAKKYSPDWIVRTTADCPFIEKRWFLDTIEMAVKYNMPVFNTYKEWSCVEVFKYSDLLRADLELPRKEYCQPYESQCREHVTMYFTKGFEKKSIDTIQDYNKARAEYKNKYVGKKWL
jgi:spore coat polysaccharide biosynthesis protein SpsF